MPKPVGTLGVIPTLTIAGLVLTDLDNLLKFHASATDGNYATLRKSGTSAGYAVTAATTLYMYAGILWCTGAAGTSRGVNMHYGDTDIGFNSVSQTTTPILAYGAGSDIGLNNAQTTGTGVQVVLLGWDIPATKYPNITSANGVTVTTNFYAYGYEV